MIEITNVEDVLNKDEDQIEFEALESAEDSPVNEPVLEKEVGHASTAVIEEEQFAPPIEEEEEVISPPPVATAAPKDAPVQNIGQKQPKQDSEEEFKLPLSHAKQAADTMLGMANNVLAVGGGFFVKIKKHQDFFDFDEIIQVIDDQNIKNVNRIKLDEEDKLLLRPILIQILRRKAKKLTPEQQLIGAALSIIMKKVQVVMEIKAENEMLTARILDIIRAERGEQQEEEETLEKREEVEEQAETTTQVTTEQQEVVEEPKQEQPISYQEESIAA